tara:strand:- start:68 stop:283 length:216 start_codon:yes stop_codon:yes gene_type:complete
MEKHKLMTTKEFIKVGIFFVVFFTLGSTESCSYEKENNVQQEISDTIVNSEVDTALWNGWRGIGNQEYRMD